MCEFDSCVVVIHGCDVRKYLPSRNIWGQYNKALCRYLPIRNIWRQHYKDLCGHLPIRRIWGFWSIALRYKLPNKQILGSGIL